MNDPNRFAPVTISTDDFPQARRLSMWRETFGRNITHVDIEPIGDEPFHAEVTFQALPDVAVAFGSRSPARYHIARPHLAHKRDTFGLTMLLSGASTTFQLGSEIAGEPGGGIVTPGTDPSTSVMHRAGRIVTIVLPRPDVAALAPNLETAFARPLPAGNGALRLLGRYVGALCQGDALQTPELARTAATHIIDLAALAIGASPDAAHLAAQRGAAAARLQSLKADIRAQLGNRDLSVAVIAAQHGVTPRYVQKLFERDGTTFSAFALRCRIARARQLLKDPRFFSHAISTIAFECGFGDLSYFNRSFRRMYGATPSDIRDAGLREARSGEREPP